MSMYEAASLFIDPEEWLDYIKELQKKPRANGDYFCSECAVGWRVEKEGPNCWSCGKEGSSGQAR